MDCEPQPMFTVFHACHRRFLFLFLDMSFLKMSVSVNICQYLNQYPGQYLLVFVNNCTVPTYGTTYAPTIRDRVPTYGFVCVRCLLNHVSSVLQYLGHDTQQS